MFLNGKIFCHTNYGQTHTNTKMSQLPTLKINFSGKIIPFFMLSQFISTRIEQSITVQMVEMERIRRMVDGD